MMEILIENTGLEKGFYIYRLKCPRCENYTQWSTGKWREHCRICDKYLQNFNKLIDSQIKRVQYHNWDNWSS